MNMDELKQAVDSTKIHWSIKAHLIHQYVQEQKELHKNHIGPNILAYQLNTREKVIWEYGRLYAMLKKFPLLGRIDSKKQALALVQSYSPTQESDLRDEINLTVTQLKLKKARLKQKDFKNVTSSSDRTNETGEENSID